MVYALYLMSKPSVVQSKRVVCIIFCHFAVEFVCYMIMENYDLLIASSCKFSLDKLSKEFGCHISFGLFVYYFH